jgi:NAD(P)-dependent dehydrogenase (short-subunit alcohol dehydrogenase family)
MDLELDGKVAVVTGASKGIGLATVRALAREGARVVAGARDVSTLTATDGLTGVPVDLASVDGPALLIERALDEHGRIDVLVNNVGGVKPRPEGFLSVSDEDWLASFTLTFFAAVRTTRAALSSIVAAGGGTIVTTCSVNAFLPDPLVIDYSAAKAALANFSKALSAEVGPQGIRVNTVSPGPVSTGLWLGDKGVAATVASATGGKPSAVAEQAASEAATGRFTEPEEVADLIVLLAGGRAGNVTGADFVIDGGLVKTI